MIDSVLKGTGNSRFLKSAVPAGTSWADALAMLQAGTFPIDFNGINTEGFQQVGTPLNKANLLKDATAAQIGLPPSTTPDGMFQALGNTGELHVWRKTVKNTEDIPAGYTLGEVQNVTKYPITDVRSGGYTIVTKAYSNLSVDDAGNVSVDESSYVNFYDDASAVRGKFIRVYSDGDILFIPNDANISTDYKTVGSAVIHNHYTDKYQSVTGYPLTPAGTTTTYPVSTNPNAYQEGDDAKAAGYTLGEVETGKFALARGVDRTVRYANNNGVKVNDDGTFNMPYDLPLTGANSSTMLNDAKVVIGRTIQQTTSYGNAYTDFPQGKTYFIPSDAATGSEGSTSYDITNYVTKRQLVTGYAAIPTGNTIEYLGKLGDKVRVQVVSYVGTGTYGESNPNSLTFDFVPKAIMVRDNEAGIRFLEAIYGMEFAVVKYSSGDFVSMIWNKKTVSWYSGNDPYYQMNSNGTKYYAVAIG